MTQLLSIVLIEDDRVAREGVLAHIRAEPGFHVVVASAHVDLALRQVHQLQPDVVLLSLLRAGDDRLALAGTLHRELPRSAVIILGLEPEREDITGFVRANVSGFIMADASVETLLSTIHRVAAGERVLPDDLTRSLFAQLKRHGARRYDRRDLDIGRLTTRERSVSELIVEGLSNKEIAARMQVSVPTIKGHVHKLLAKLDMNGRLEVAAFGRSRMTEVVVGE